MSAELTNLIRASRMGAPSSLVNDAPHAWRDAYWYWRYQRPACGA